MERYIEEELLRLIDLLYDAALDVERWPVFLNALVEPFGAACGALDLFDPKSNATQRLLDFGREAAFTASYAQHYAALNPYPAAAFLKAPVGKVIPATDVVGEGDVIGTEFYNDWLRPQGINPRHLRLVLEKDKDSMLLFTMMPQVRETRWNLDKYSKRLELLAPHLARAIALNRNSASARATERVMGEILQAFEAPAFLLDRADRIVAANTPGEALMRQEQVLRLDPLGGLCAARPAEDGAFKAALAKVQGARGLTQGPVRLLSCRSGSAWLAWILSTRPRSSDGSCQRFRLMEESPRATALVLVTLAAAAAGARISVDAIKAAFGLSTAEARLASALVAGRTLAEYADRTGHSLTTVRNQLAAVFDKTATHRQSELVLLIAGRLATAERASSKGV
jgi:DNA-binding CsgD family transcriptional regulator